MKNSIVLKFIALLLCAASLLGVLGSAGGILVLTETGLYEKTAEQLYEEELQSYGKQFAYTLAQNYADTELGGCPDAMLADIRSIGVAPFAWNRYGYALKDAEGNVLRSSDLEYEGDVTTLAFPVTGQYMYLVDQTSASREQVEQVKDTAVQNGDWPVYRDEIPAEGANITKMEIVTQNGESFFATEDLGTAFHTKDGLVVFRCIRWAVDYVDAEGTTLTYVALWDEGGSLVYHAEAPMGVATIRPAETGENLVMESWYTRLLPEKEAAGQPLPETEPVIEPETEPEIVPEERSEEAAAETKPEQTASEQKEAPKEDSDGASKETEPEQEPSEKQGETKKGSEDAAEETEPEKKSSKKKTDSPETDSGEKTKKTESQKTEADSEEAPPAVTESAQTHSEENAGETEATLPETTEAAAPETEPALPQEPLLPETVPQETIPEPVVIQGRALGEYQLNKTNYWDSQRQETVTARFVYVPMPEMTVELYLAPDALNGAYRYTVLAMIRSVRNYLLPTLGICLLVLAMTAVYLCCSAGRSAKSEEVRAGGLNRLPLEAYGLSVLSGVTCCVLVTVEGGEYFLRRNVLLGSIFAVSLSFLACLLVVGFCFAFVAQIKTPGGFWWRNSLVGWCLRLIKYLWIWVVRVGLWMKEKLVQTGIPVLGSLILWVWHGIARIWKWFWNLVKKCALGMLAVFNRFLNLLPMTWQWMIAGFVMIMLVFLTVAARFDLGMLLSVLFAFALVLYGAHCFGILLETTKKMNKGDLDSKVDDKLMVGAFKTFAQDLNDLAGVAVVAAQKQLKSERMKTELITNVSHDIKTPLTSIINYVDLMQKPHTQEEEQQYLEVLDRQSQRLKKLIDDLMDMSKASTGNMAVDITLVDAVESVNQALGEFGDKLDRAQLIPVFRHTEPSVAMMADGKLVWRVLSNLLGNAVKYAMPGTRLYIDLMTLENKVVISLKNISREELNVDAEELMERFVRGDDSRNTEGSGLGLNIAKSLMELQKGQLQLLVDGDLFKVTLIFPGV